MAELEFSQFGDDLKAIIVGIVDAMAMAWPDIPATEIHVDRTFVQRTAPEYAVVVLDSVQLQAAESGEVSLLQILQTFSFTLIRVGKIERGMNVIFEKIDRYDALAAQLMPLAHFLGSYELPSITNVDFSESEPDPDKYVLSIDFNVRAANWRYAEPVSP